jgi:ZIP family zinc transporter
MPVALARSWPSRLIGLVLAFGAGALVSAVRFELSEERRWCGADTGCPTSA